MSGPAPERVVALFANLGHQLGSVVEAALDIDLAGGTSDPWDALLSSLKVPKLGEDARFDAAQADRQVKGAPIAEVRSCIEAAVKEAAQAWAVVGASLPMEQHAQADRALATLAEEAVRRYRTLATTRQKGMFAHAKAAAAEHRWDGFAVNQGYVLKCPSCGAPRIGADLLCAFCGGKMGG